MIQASQQISEITRSNIVNLFPEYDPEYAYIVESPENATFRSTVRIGNYLYHSTAQDNKNNYPLDTLGVFWSKGDVSNIYAMLDFENITQTEWGGDGAVEFHRGLVTILALGALTAGCVKVEMLEPKNGVIEGLVFSNTGGIAYQLTGGKWYADSIYYDYSDGWEFLGTDMDVGQDNYIYPQVPREAQNFDGARGVEVNGSIAFIASSQSNSITAIDISNPSTVTQLSSLVSSSLGGATDIEILNNVAFVVSDDADSITAIDISNPSAMTELDSYTSASLDRASRISIKDSVAYVVSFGANSITAIDITDPSAMTELDSYTSANLSGARGLDIDGTQAYVISVDTDSITAIDISNPSAMTETSSFTTSSLDGANRVAISNQIAYVTSKTPSNSLTAVDISNPAVMTKISSLSLDASSQPEGITIDGTVAYIALTVVSLVYSEYVISVDISNPAVMVELDNVAASIAVTGHSVAVLQDNIFVTSPSRGLISINAISPSDLIKLDSFPNNAPLTIGVPYGDPQPETPAGKIPIWMVSLDAIGNQLSLTDLREFENDTVIEGLTQIKTFYNEGKGAAYFVLPELGDIVRVTFKQANNAGTACGTMIAGKGVDLGQTLSKPSFSQVPALRGYVKEANITTLVDDRDITLVANEANKAIDEWSLFVVDPSENSSYQQILMLAQMKEPSFDIASSTKQHLKLRIQGDELINEIPLGVYDVAYFIAGVTEVLEVYKGCGNMSFIRPITATYVDKYGNTKTAAIDEPRFQDGMLMSGSGEVCWYDAVESIPTFVNGFTLEWEGITDSLSASNGQKTYIMSNTDVQLYFRNQFLYFYLNGSTIVYALPTLNEMMKVEIRAESNGEVKMIIDDVEVASETMNISDVSSSLTYIGSHNGSANTSGVLLQTASHKWYNAALDNPTTTIQVEVWVNESVIPWVDESANQWTTG